MAVEDRPSLIICRTHIALRLAQQAGQRQRPRLAAGRGGDRLTKEALRLADRAALLRPATRRSRTAARRSRAARRRRRDWQERFDAYRAAHPALAAELEAIGERRPPSLPAGMLVHFDRRRRSRRARPRRSSSRSPPRSCRRCSAARPTSRLDADVSTAAATSIAPAAAQHALRDPRARDGRRQRAQLGGCAPMSRRSSCSPTTCGRPCASRRSTSTPAISSRRTTRSALARTVRRISRSSI